MRFHLLGLVLMAGVALPANAQRQESLDRRVDRMEQELRAVQRRVFPNANAPYVAGEIQNPTAVPTPSGVPATSAVADLTARIDALEGQLRALTNQEEVNSNRLRVLETSLEQLRTSSTARLDALEHGGAPAAGDAGSDESASAPPPRATRPEPARPSTSRPAPSRDDEDSAPTTASSGSSGGSDTEAEQAYNAGFRLWDQKRYGEAQTALLQVAKKYPKSKWASYANNLAGRAYLDDNKPVQAARILLANYQNDPKGARAPDSLFYVGQALVEVGKPEAACKAYDELEDVYGRGLRAELRQRLPAARTAAKCK